MPTDRTAAPPGVFTPAFFQDAHPVFDTLRERAPATLVTGVSGTRLWLIPRYEEARVLLSSPSVRKGDWKRPDLLREQHLTRSERRREMTTRIRAHMVAGDHPDHQRLRQGTQQALGRHRIDSLRPRIELFADETLDALAAARGAGPVEFRAKAAYPFTVAVVSELLGLPEEEQAGFPAWFDALMCRRGSDSVRKASAILSGFTERLADRRRAHPARGLLSTLGSRTDGRRPLTRQELASTAFLLLIAGIETANAIANGVFTLLSHPEQYAALRADRSLLPGAVEECLRHDGPFRAVGPRYTVARVDLGEGVSIPAGEFLLIAVAAANRDPRRFPDPHRFDITRTDHAHLALGYGTRRCAGAALARAQMEILLGRLLDRFPGLRPGVPLEEVRRRPSMTMNWLQDLPVLLR
ncbi:cytochrome P450 [Streptomyces sp. UNOC14_S4]|uniref:cytochrome P450 n=1 Tax=Streptomyces sp. UNOC14_S4 TaxID=2872340 RepID=UPI001E476FFA|nr:cytochrome P450 [Streptomyces sp. UNOC14_S4]MCC3772296.1 cytochrome P450 [Streptomyces sp. UNOC14_S4]